MQLRRELLAMLPWRYMSRLASPRRDRPLSEPPEHRWTGPSTCPHLSHAGYTSGGEILEAMFHRHGSPLREPTRDARPPINRAADADCAHVLEPPPEVVLL